MTNEQLKELEDNLWEAANNLRAYGGIKASDYQVPIMGLIFLRFADNRYAMYVADINAVFEAEKDSRRARKIEDIAIEKCGFYLPEIARYDYLLNLKGDKRAEAITKAMDAIEDTQDETLHGLLPRREFFDIEKKKEDILPQLLKLFKDIPPTADGDLFGKIYEYFLGKFALSEGQKGGQFFTPTSVVRFIVEMIEPYAGKIFDPACGSGGMFVQSAKFVAEANKDSDQIFVYGQEFMGATVQLAKMNLMVNKLRGEIVECNSYSTNHFESEGKFDFVMANPPFNVKTVKESTVKDDTRFTKYGLPKGKGKKVENISDANYLWVSLFATSLNKNGRAGFVMPNSASDARNAEYDIRKRIVDNGIIDCMVTMPSNMFFTVTLPATLWFFDKAKVKTERKDKILFIDARNTYKQIDRAHREWTPEQIHNLSVIKHLYKGEIVQFSDLVQQYLVNSVEQIPVSINAFEDALKELTESAANILDYEKHVSDKLKPAKRKLWKDQKASDTLEGLKDFKLDTKALEGKLFKKAAEGAKENKKQHDASAQLEALVKVHNAEFDALKKAVASLVELLKVADKQIKQKADKKWGELLLTKAEKRVNEALSKVNGQFAQLTYWLENIQWLQERFPDGKYVDVVGLCKIADRVDIVEEQDYSLNAGRYVGVEIEDDKMSKEDFVDKLMRSKTALESFNEQAQILESEILENLELVRGL